MNRTLAQILGLTLVCGLLLISTTSCDSSSQEQSKRYRLIHNNDGSDALLNRWFGGEPVHKADIDRYVDMVAHTPDGKTQVTTFMMCSGSDYIYYPDSK